MLAAFSLIKVESQSIVCEKVDSNRAWLHVGQQKTCYMQEKTAIEFPGHQIETPTDESIGALTFQRNKKISFLPFNAGQNFPNMIVYDAGDCSIEIISKENFAHLTRLQHLYLCCNKIETVFSETFEDLKSLALLGLGR